MKNDSQIFIDAIAKLSAAVVNLEESIFEKLRNKPENNLKENDSKEVKNLEENIKNLNNEINLLKNNLAESTVKNKLLNKENTEAKENLENIKNTFSEVKNNIKFDLEKIRSFINQN
jgi:predicted  nucleic acid-binding Zn-ribbon protein